MAITPLPHYFPKEKVHPAVADLITRIPPFISALVADEFTDSLESSEEDGEPMLTEEAQMKELHYLIARAAGEMVVDTFYDSDADIRQKRKERPLMLAFMRRHGIARNE